ncbi:MAG: DUF5667 domain-containing protein [Candidatus Dormibacterales bacterium]
MSASRVAGPPSKTDPIASRAEHFEPEALVELYERSLDRVHGLVYALTGDQELAGEVTRAAYMGALDRLGELARSSADAVDWLLLIAARAAFGAGPAAGESREGQIRRRLAALRPSEREAVALDVVGGAGPAGAATAMRRREGAVRLMVARGLRSAGVAPVEAESLPRPPASEALRARLKTIFLAEAAQRRVGWVHRHPLAVRQSHRPEVRRFHFGSAVLTVFFLGVALVLGVLVAVAAGFSDPGSPLYGLKRGGENVLMAVTRDPVSRSNLDVSLASQRLKEAEVTAVNGDGSTTLQLLYARDSDLTDAAVRLAAADRGQAGWTAARDRLEAEAAQPVSGLAQSLAAQDQGGRAKAVEQEASHFRARWGAVVKQLATPPPKAVPSPAASPAHS